MLADWRLKARSLDREGLVETGVAVCRIGSALRDLAASSVSVEVVDKGKGRF